MDEESSVEKKLSFEKTKQYQEAAVEEALKEIAKDTTIEVTF